MKYSSSITKEDTIGGFALFLCVVGGLYLVSWGYRQYAYTEEVQGLVIKNEEPREVRRRRSLSGITRRLEIRYKTDERQQIPSTFQEDVFFLFPYQTGDVVPVLYDRNNASHAMLKEMHPLKGALALLGVVWMGFVLRKALKKRTPFKKRG